MQAQEIQNLIQAHLPESQVLVSGDDGRHFQVVVISENFKEKSLLQQQQAVYAPLQSYIQAGSLHALSLKTYTPDQWNTLNLNTNTSK